MSPPIAPLQLYAYASQTLDQHSYNHGLYGGDATTHERCLVMSGRHHDRLDAEEEHQRSEHRHNFRPRVDAPPRPTQHDRVLNSTDTQNVFEVATCAYSTMQCVARCCVGIDAVPMMGVLTLASLAVRHR